MLEGNATARAFLDANLVQAGLLEVERTEIPGERCRSGAEAVGLPDAGLILAGIDEPGISGRRFSAAFTRIPAPPGDAALLARPAGEQRVRSWTLRLPADAAACRLP